MNLVEPAPRVLTKEENPSLAKRNRRMFGALLGTLQVTLISYSIACAELMSVLHTVFPCTSSWV